jgi:hypothetical protein
MSQVEMLAAFVAIRIVNVWLLGGVGVNADAVGHLRTPEI